MADDYKESERKLRTLAKRLRRGQEKLFPVGEKELEQVHQAIRQQWTEQQRTAQSGKKSWEADMTKGKLEEHKAEKKKKQEQSESESRSKKKQSQSKDQSHGHSH